MKASSGLVKYVPKDRKETFNIQYEGNKLLFRVIQAALSAKIDLSLSTQDAFSIHEYSSLSNVLADHAGYRRAIKEIIALLPKDK